MNNHCRLKPSAATLAAWLALSIVLPHAHAQDSAQVGIVQQRFIPALLTVKAGTTVTWTNAERRTGHSVRSPGQGGFQSPIIMPGQSWQRTFDKPGIYPYACGPHPEMQGIIEVTE